MSTTIRKIIKSDTPAIKHVLNSIELFPPEMLEDMMADYLSNTNTTDIWFTATEDDEPVSVGYCAHEQLTEGTYNLYAIGVRQDMHGKGIGQQMMHFIEDELKQAGHHVLIVETSSDATFERTRNFYLQLGYRQEAVLHDFWKLGEHKVIYWKKLN